MKPATRLLKWKTFYLLPPTALLQQSWKERMSSKGPLPLFSHLVIIEVGRKDCIILLALFLPTCIYRISFKYTYPDPCRFRRNRRKSPAVGHSLSSPTPLPRPVKIEPPPHVPVPQIPNIGVNTIYVDRMALKNPPRALLFDVFGTCVDWRSSVTKALNSETRRYVSRWSCHLPLYSCGSYYGSKFSYKVLQLEP